MYWDVVSLSNDCSAVSDPDVGLRLKIEFAPPPFTNLKTTFPLLPLSRSDAWNLTTSVPGETFYKVKNYTIFNC